MTGEVPWVEALGASIVDCRGGQTRFLIGMFLNIILVHLIGMLGTLVFWGANPRAPIGG